MQWLFTTPLQRDPMNGGGNVSGIKVLGDARINPDTLVATISVQYIEDVGPGMARTISTVPGVIAGNTTYAQTAGIFKAMIAAALGVTFQ